MLVGNIESSLFGEKKFGMFDLKKKKKMFNILVFPLFALMTALILFVH